MKKFLSMLAVVLTTCQFGQAAIVFTSPGTLTETFDGLSTTTVSNVFSATAGTQTAIPGSTFDGTKLSGTGSAATPLTADAGGGSSGSIYSYGAASVPERALGTVASGTNIMGFGVMITNNTGADIASLTVSFTQENWRTSTSVVNTTVASYGTTETGATSSDYLTASGFTAVTDLDLVGPAFVGSNGPLDGNLPANQVARTFTFSGTALGSLGVLPDGASFFLRWQDANDAGNDAGLAIDGFSVTATPVPEPSTVALGALAGLGFLGFVLRRKQG
jgi:hypothetical protein